MKCSVWVGGGVPAYTIAAHKIATSSCESSCEQLRMSAILQWDYVAVAVSQWAEQEMLKTIKNVNGSSLLLMWAVWVGVCICQVRINRRHSLNLKTPLPRMLSTPVIGLFCVTVAPDGSPQSTEPNFPSPPGNSQKLIPHSPLIN